MNQQRAMRLVRLGYAGAAGVGVGSFVFWTAYWFSFVRGNLRGPDFFNFYAAAKLYVTNGGAAVYDIALRIHTNLAGRHLLVKRKSRLHFCRQRGVLRCFLHRVGST